MPRLAKPRVKVPKGAVAIADKQTAVYPNSSPGGWHILGLCPLDLRQKATAINAFKVGDSVRFEAIDAAQYEAILSSQNESKIG
jgi:allophanate hydrolase subunit 1